MDPALASLLGAIVGGVIGGSSNMLLDAKRARRESASIDAASRRQARRAARVVMEELSAGQRLLAKALDRGEIVWDPTERQLPTESWNRYSPDLALVADGDEWQAASDAVLRFDEINWHLRAVLEEERWTGAGPRDPLDARDLGPKTRDLMTEASDAAIHALSMLRTLA